MSKIDSSFALHKKSITTSTCRQIRDYDKKSTEKKIGAFARIYFLFKTSDLEVVSINTKTMEHMTNVGTMYDAL